jgi:serine/threonine protein kinase
MVEKDRNDPNYSMTLSSSCIEFIFSLLETDPSKRISAQDALKHRWFLKLNQKTKPKHKLKKFRENNQIPSLKTILECSEISEREFSRFGSSFLPNS